MSANIYASSEYTFDVLVISNKLVEMYVYSSTIPVVSQSGQPITLSLQNSRENCCDFWKYAVLWL